MKVEKASLSFVQPLTLHIDFILLSSFIGHKHGFLKRETPVSVFILTHLTCQQFLKGGIVMKTRRKRGILIIFTTVMKALSAIVWPITGFLFDLLANLYPLFTIIGTIAGVAHITFAIRKKQGEKEEKKSWPIIESSVEEIRQAVRIYSDQLPKGVYRTILVKDDHSIDLEQLAPILKGIPAQNFYMSKETYDIFAENEKDLAITLDKVQRAVDHYVKEFKEYPVLPFDPSNRVNYYQLLKAHCLDAEPEIELYITNYDGLVTHKQAEKNSTMMKM
jgi:hypothetical protein